MARHHNLDIYRSLMRGDVLGARETLDEAQQVPAGQFPLRRYERLRQHLDDGDIQHAICWVHVLLFPSGPLNEAAHYRQAMERMAAFLLWAVQSLGDIDSLQIEYANKPGPVLLTPVSAPEMQRVVVPLVG